MSRKTTAIAPDVLKSLAGKKKRRASKSKAGGAVPTNLSRPPVRFGKINKFNVAPVEKRTGADGTVYDSKLERDMSEWLRMAHPEVPVISQPSFELQPGFRDYAGGQLVRAIRYVADFMIGPHAFDGRNYTPLPGAVVMDAKGMETPDFRMKAKMFRYRFGIDVTRVKNKTARAAALKIFAAFETMNEILKARAADGQPFTVRGYKAADGSVSDKVVRFVGRSGYLELVRASRDQLLDTGFPEGMTPADAVEWNMAKQELLQSYNARLGEGESASTPRTSSETLVPVCDGLALLDGDPTKVVAFSMVALSDEVTAKAPVKTTKSAAKTVFKRQIERGLPLAGYIFRLNLYEGNYSNIL